MDSRNISNPGSALCRTILECFDLGAPGFGSDPYHEAPLNHPAAYGLILSAAAKIGHNEVGRVCARWLTENCYLSSDGRAGWGLPFAYQCGGLASNPPHTIYGITNAFVALGLLDWFESTGDSSALEAVRAALTDYLDFFNGESFSYFPNADASFSYFPNADAMLAGQYARLHGETRFVGVATAVYDNLLRIMQGNKGWPYQVGRSKKNDWSYITYGLREVERQLGLPSRSDPAFAYLGG